MQGQFAGCREKFTVLGDTFTGLRFSCAINVLLADGGYKAHRLEAHERQYAHELAVGPFEDVAPDDPSQSYALVTLRFPADEDGVSRRAYRLIKARGWHELSIQMTKGDKA